MLRGNRLRLGVVFVLIIIGTSVIGAPAQATKPECKAINQTQEVAFNSNAYPDPLGTAIAGARSGDTIKVIGTCMGNYSITKDLALTGRKSDQHTDLIASGGSGAVLNIAGGDVNVDVSDLTITGGAVGIQNTAATVSLTRMRISDNATGIVSTFAASMTIDDSLVSDNDHDGIQGGLFGTVTIRNSVVSGNGGSGVAGFRTGVTIVDTTIANNSERGAWSRGLDITRSLIQGNGNGTGLGGGIATTDLGVLHVTDSIVRNNAAADGGGIWLRMNFGSGASTITRSVITGNHATGDGGGINGPGEEALVIVDSLISNNSATRGGGLFLEAPMLRGTTQITNSHISGNSAVHGGGIWNSRPLTLTDATVTANTATTAGGGIYGTGVVTLNGANSLCGNSPDDWPGCSS